MKGKYLDCLLFPLVYNLVEGQKLNGLTDV